METDVQVNKDQAGPSISDMIQPVVTAVEAVPVMDGGKEISSVSGVPAGTTITVVDAGQTSDLGGLLQASEMMEIITQEVSTLAQANGNVSDSTGTTTVTPVMAQNGVVLQASELMKQIMEQVNIKQEDGEDTPHTVYAEIRPPDQMLIDDPGTHDKQDGTSGDGVQGQGQLVDSFAMYTQEDQGQEIVQQSADVGGSTKVLHVQATQEPIDGDPNNVQTSSRTLTVVITNFPDHLKTQILSYSCMSCGSAFNEVVDLMSHVCTGTVPLISNASSVVINTGVGGSAELDPNKTVISASDLFYRCDDCPKKFMKKTELTRHKQTHRKGGDGIDVKHPLVNRVELMHPTAEEQRIMDDNIINTESGMFQCAICLKCCKRKFDLKRHLLTHSNVRNRPHTCPHCDKRFLTASHLRQHLRAHAGIKPFECDDCGKAFTRSSEVTRHKVVHMRTSGSESSPVTVPPNLTTLSYECTDCAETFVNKKDLQLHLFEKHTYQCKQCASVFPTMATLEQHMAEHSQVYTCIECSMVFVHKKQLKQHNKQKHRDKRHRHHHHHHHRNKHEDGSSRHKHACPDCGKEFRKTSDLKRHAVTHTERERRHECEICHKKFLTSSHLKAHHMQKHSEERPNQCPFCDKKFARKHDLKRHMAIHDSDRERPYTCEHCGKNYITASHLRDHMVVHSGVQQTE
ncbi:uncharacterized protein [Diadema setosum]|uniref:uncharacterized protein n=1 Tax=Diadema setosum TaxID=31175 RepID=UPI003B3A3791